MYKRFMALGVSFVVSLGAMSLMMEKPKEKQQPVSPASVQESKVLSEVSATYLAESLANEVTSPAAAVASAPDSRRNVSSRGGSVPRPELKYGEALDWWKEADKDFPRESIAEVTDLKTGKSFKVKRTYGTNHADCEALTIEDTNIIKSIWGGFSWDRRPVVVKINGLRIAASMTAMPHAGLDGKPANSYVKNRSGGFGSGTNLDAIKGNGMDGHFDIHFLNSRRHNDNQKDPQHQANVMVAAGK